MTQETWNVVLSALVYAALTGIFNLVFARKSQINAWCEANPRLAALFKFTRMIGLDPQHGWAFLTLLVKKRLPAVQTEPPSEEDLPVRFGPGAGSLLILLGGIAFGSAYGLTGCAGSQPAPGCTDAEYRTQLLNCSVMATSCVQKGGTDDECGSVCDTEWASWQERCSQ